MQNQEVKRDRQKEKREKVPTIKSRSPSNVAYRINGKKNWYSLRGDRIVQNIEWIDLALTGDLIMRTKPYLIKTLNIRDKTVS